MKNAVILHGSGNDSSGNWYPWLKKILEAKDYKVWVSDLPNSDTPDQDEWTDFIFSNKDWEFNEDSVIIGHSAGATVILRILEKLPDDIKIKRAVLVAPYANKGNLPQYYKYRVGMLKTAFNWKKIKSSCQEFIFIASDNDPYDCGSDQSRILQEYLSGELIMKHGQGHFNLEAGEKYRKFPELLEYT